MRLLDSLLPAKRIEEWCIINNLISSENHSTTIEEIKNSLKKHVDYCKEENILNACNFLAGKFFDSTEEKTYGDVITKKSTVISVVPDYSQVQNLNISFL